MSSYFNELDNLLDMLTKHIGNKAIIKPVCAGVETTDSRVPIYRRNPSLRFGERRGKGLSLLYKIWWLLSLHTSSRMLSGLRGDTL